MLIATTPNASAIIAQVRVSNATNQRSTTMPAAAAATKGASGAITNLAGCSRFSCGRDRELCVLRIVPRSVRRRQPFP